MANRDEYGRTLPERNPDPLTGEAGSHPIGTGVGAVGGALTGAAVGAAVGGPVGAALGGAIGAASGGLAGKGLAEGLNPTLEDEYWRITYVRRPYVPAGRPYEDYQSAYRYGWEASERYPGRTFEELEADLAAGWDKFKGESRLAWLEAKAATRDAWYRVRHAFSEATDRDRR
jgi:hypothetical protein